MSKFELENLKNTYLFNNIRETKGLCFPFNESAITEVIDAFCEAVNFERPDGYCIHNEVLYIFEHFAIDSSVQDTDLVTNQMPKKGVQLLDNANVFLYTDNSSVSTSVTVPNFKGMSASEAINSASEHKLNIVLDGSGIVISQDIAAESSVEIGSVINLTLKSELNGGW